MAMASILQVINALTGSKNVDVYLLFKTINQDHYTKSVRISHWQVVCHFKDTNRYKCYELQTDNGDIGGNIVYRITNFRFNGTIYYYYVGQCDASETEIERKCDSIIINNLQYILGFRDCQTWATLLIENLGLSVNSIGSILSKYFLLIPYSFTETIQARAIDLVTEANATINFLLSQVKTCHGYRNLDPTHKLPFTDYL